MVFSSLNFLLIFFPLVMLLHLIAPKWLKNPVLLVFSIVFYAWGEPVYIVLMLLSVGLNYVIGLQIGLERRVRMRLRQLILGVAINLAALGFFKYYGFLLDTINALLHVSIRYTALPLPIGISFYTFQAMSYIIDVYRQKVKPQQSLIDFALYITMFPQLVAGPIVQYSDIEKQLRKRSTSLTQCGQGLERVVQGLAKKVLLANNLGLLYDSIQASASRSVLSAWIGAIAYAMQIYFDFSGYSDMAIGMGKMLGFTFLENFNYPYLSKSVTEFWRRWHISLSSWFRDYVYIPLGGNRVSVLKHVRNLLIVWMLTGLWHGASWNFVLWGLYYGLLLVLERYALKEALQRLPQWAQRVYTLLLVLIGWVIFSNTSFQEMSQYLGNLVGVGTNGFVDQAALYSLRGNFVLLVISGLCCTEVIRKRMVKRMYDQPVVAVVTSCALFVLSIAYLVYGSYNPFLYFRF